ncbi:uncharacterized protein [Procambarus clarkii]|uniref:uncharacterized protein n=1 Tax=Procambarus clarkii TaxID=6728 RepID=UPI0037432A3C
MEEKVAALVAHPDFEGIQNLKKTELIQMANQLDLTASNRMVKAQILKVIVTHFVENGELDEEILEELREESSDQMTLKRLELEARQLELEAQKEQKILEAEAQQRELETRRLEIAAQNQRGLIELQLEATKKQQLEIQQQMADTNFRLESQRMAAGHGNTSNVSTNSDNNPIRMNKYIELPKFNEEDPEVFFAHFYKIAISMNWPRDQWVAIMQSQFKGRSQEVFTSLPDSHSFDYDFVKKSILNAYQLNPEAHRQRFRNLRRTSDQTIADFTRQKTKFCNRWLKSLPVTDFDALKNLLIMEEVLSCLPDQLSTFMAEQKNVTDIDELSKLADEHELLTKAPFTATSPKSSRRVNFNAHRTPYQYKSPPGATVTPVNFSLTNPKMVTPLPGSSKPSNANSKPTVGSTSVSTVRSCSHCKRKGHGIHSCFILHPELRPTGLIYCRGVQNKLTNNHVTVNPNWVKQYSPYLSSGEVLCINGKWKPVVILRDTGASQTIISSSILSDVEKRETGKFVVLQSVAGCKTVPLIDINFRSTITPRLCTVRVSTQLPIPGVDVILGNDVAINHVVGENDPRLCKQPVADHVYSACAEVSSMNEPVVEDGFVPSTCADVSTLINPVVSSDVVTQAFVPVTSTPSVEKWDVVVPDSCVADLVVESKPDTMTLLYSNKLGKDVHVPLSCPLTTNVVPGVERNLKATTLYSSQVNGLGQDVGLAEVFPLTPSLESVVESKSVVEAPPHPSQGDIIGEEVKLPVTCPLASDSLHLCALSRTDPKISERSKETVCTVDPVLESVGKQPEDQLLLSRWRPIEPPSSVVCEDVTQLGSDIVDCEQTVLQAAPEVMGGNFGKIIKSGKAAFGSKLRSCDSYSMWRKYFSLCTLSQSVCRMLKSTFILQEPFSCEVMDCGTSLSSLVVEQREFTQVGCASSSEEVVSYARAVSLYSDPVNFDARVIKVYVPLKCGVDFQNHIVGEGLNHTGEQMFEAPGVQFKLEDKVILPSVNHCEGFQIVLGRVPGNLLFIFKMLRPLNLLVDWLSSDVNHLGSDGEGCKVFGMFYLVSWKTRRLMNVCVVFKFTIRGCELVLRVMIEIWCLGICLFSFTDRYDRVMRQLISVFLMDHLSQFDQVVFALILGCISWLEGQRFDKSVSCVSEGSMNGKVLCIIVRFNATFSNFSIHWARVCVPQRIKSDEQMSVSEHTQEKSQLNSTYSLLQLSSSAPEKGSNGKSRLSWENSPCEKGITWKNETDLEEIVETYEKQNCHDYCVKAATYIDNSIHATNDTVVDRSVKYDLKQSEINEIVPWRDKFAYSSDTYVEHSHKTEISEFPVKLYLECFHICPEMCSYYLYMFGVINTINLKCHTFYFEKMPLIFNLLHFFSWRWKCYVLLAEYVYKFKINIILFYHCMYMYTHCVLGKLSCGLAASVDRRAVVSAHVYYLIDTGKLDLFSLRVPDVTLF